MRTRSGGVRPNLAGSERMDRQRAEHHGRDQREGAVQRSRVQPSFGPPGQRTRIQVEAGFRRYFAHGRSPGTHYTERRAVRGGTQATAENSDANASIRVDGRQKFSAASATENFIR